MNNIPDEIKTIGVQEVKHLQSHSPPKNKQSNIYIHWANGLSNEDLFLCWLDHVIRMSDIRLLNQKIYSKHLSWEVITSRKSKRFKDVVKGFSK